MYFKFGRERKIRVNTRLSPKKYLKISRKIIDISGHTFVYHQNYYVKKNLPVWGARILDIFMLKGQSNQPMSSINQYFLSRN